ncbi:GPI-anchored protein 52 [[Candida] railenensis]|uniref:glucan endo-1,3-beta-D-glucosidase n=1 Tax=[Candida] railenensis TaxID=45579 RepID=A0A9P0QTP5_9ASCO|nr:GPI-anchored protein 52 [[Candida] railenensis]
MKFLTSALASIAAVQAASSSYGVIEFENLGYSGTYKEVAKISDVYTDDCTCKLSDSTTSFSGSNAPLNEELSVHFRGPLILSKFAYYVAESFTHGESGTDDWSRLAYYDASSATATNVTFLNLQGKNSTCLGMGVTYASSNGTGAADSPTVLDEGVQLLSGEEYIIMSNISCESSGSSKDCGIYRTDNEAYHGFYGTTKMFLFEFQMPTESTLTKEEVSAYNMPAIWLLNAQIPRTSQYPTNSYCSCWSSGCGEFDIFEVMNTTETSHLYSTVHDFQGTGDISDGLMAYGYLPRDSEGTMRGGVVFDSAGTAVVFMSNSTSIDANISASDINSWISDAGTVLTDTLSSVAAASSSKSSSNGVSITTASFWSNIVISAFTMLYTMFG